MYLMLIVVLLFFKLFDGFDSWWCIITVPLCTFALCFFFGAAGLTMAYTFGMIH